LCLGCIAYPKRRSKKTGASRKTNRRARTIAIAVPKLSEEFLAKGTGGNQDAETDQKQACGARLRCGCGHHIDLAEKNALTVPPWSNVKKSARGGSEGAAGAHKEILGWNVEGRSLRALYDTLRTEDVGRITGNEVIRVCTLEAANPDDQIVKTLAGRYAGQKCADIEFDKRRSAASHRVGKVSDFVVDGEV
jgi:hypothetical protein